MMSEEWKTILRYPNYEVSNRGNVRRKGARKNLAIDPNSNGYSRVQLCEGGASKRVFVHRLVAEAFLDKADGATVVNHLDCNSKNNSVDNLEWCTQIQNMRYMVKMGREGNKSKPVRGTNIKTGEVVEYHSTQEAQRLGGFWSIHVSSCCRGKLKQHHGYKFEYIAEE